MRSELSVHFYVFFSFLLWILLWPRRYKIWRRLFWKARMLEVLSEPPLFSWWIEFASWDLHRTCVVVGSLLDICCGDAWACNVVSSNNTSEGYHTSLFAKGRKIIHYVLSSWSPQKPTSTSSCIASFLYFSTHTRSLLNLFSRCSSFSRSTSKLHPN